MKWFVNAAGSLFPAAGRVFCEGSTLASPRKMLDVPSVTMKGCRFRLTTSPPLISPHTSPMPSATSAARGSTTHAGASADNPCNAAAVPSAASAIVAPTEMSMPPVMMTTVMPTAMIA